MGKPVKDVRQDKSHARVVYGGLTALTGALLAAVFIAPFYGALDAPVPIVESGQGAGASGNGIVVEQFDYNEPETKADKPETPPASSEDAGTGGEKIDDGGFQREAPRPPMSDMGLAATPKPPEPPAPPTPVAEGEGMQLLQRPVAIAAGRLESQGRIVELEGIEVLPIEQTCQSPSGENWPCGMQARTVFRQWLRSRAVMCRLPQNDSGSAVATHCTVGNEDAAAWLVSNGWAKAVAGGAYEEAGQKAEQAGLGLYGDRPATALPDIGTVPDITAPSPDVEPQPFEPQLRPTQDGYFPPPPPSEAPAPAN